MPRRSKNPPEDRDHWRDLFVSRLVEEQERRGFSDAQVAYKAAVYVPMAASTVWKIKNAEPARRIDLDEARAIMLAFDFSSFDEFLAGDEPLSQAEHLALQAQEGLQHSAALNAKTLAALQQIAGLVIANPPYDRKDLRFLEPLDAAAREQREQTARMVKEIKKARLGPTETDPQHLDEA